MFTWTGFAAGAVVAVALFFLGPLVVPGADARLEFAVVGVVLWAIVTFRCATWMENARDR